MAESDNKVQMVTFQLGAEQYGIDISKIKEILAPINITHIPKTPDFVKGVINLRGSIIPVVDIQLMPMAQISHRMQVLRQIMIKIYLPTVPGISASVQ